MPKSIRIHNVDVLKGIGIVLMIIGHLEISTHLRSVIYSFHMPLFFFVSGVLWKDKHSKLSIGQFLSREGSKLLYPYFVFSALQILQSFVENGRNGEWIQVVNRVISTLLGVRSIVPYGELNYLGLLWFFPALLTTEILFYFAKRCRYTGVVISVYTIIGVLYAYYIGELFRIPLCIDVALLSCLFMYVGDLCSIIDTAVVKNVKTKIIAGGV